MTENVKRTARQVFMRVAASVVVLIVVAFSVVLFFSAMFVGGAASFDPQDITTQAQWVGAIADTANGAVSLIITAAVGLAIAAGAATVAAWQRSRLWLSTTVICGAILLAMLLFVSNAGFSTLNHAAEQAREFHRASAEDHSSPRKPLALVFSSEEIQSEIRTMIVATGASSTGVKTPQGVDTTAAAIPISSDGCASASFAVASSADGSALEGVLDVWRNAGYVVQPDRTSSYLATSETLAIAYAQIQDRETINGLIGIRIAGWCGATL